MTNILEKTPNIRRYTVYTPDDLRLLHERLGVCHRHPTERVSTSGGYPRYDGLCGACEAEMDAEADRERAETEGAR